MLRTNKPNTGPAQIVIGKFVTHKIYVEHVEVAPILSSACVFRVDKIVTLTIRKMSRTYSSLPKSITTADSSPSYRKDELESRGIFIRTEHSDIPPEFVSLLDQLILPIQPLRALPTRTSYDSIFDSLEGHIGGLSSSIGLASHFPEEIKRSSGLKESLFSYAFWLTFVYKELYHDSELAFS